MQAMTLTPESIAQDIVTKHFDDVVEFMNGRAARLVSASYSSGAYGRIMLPLLQKHFPRVNWNGQSTRVALAVQNEMEKHGYKFSYNAGDVSFAKVPS